jgi:tetratricopeptide (TPR) repeat protein
VLLEDEEDLPELKEQVAAFPASVAGEEKAAQRAAAAATKDRKMVAALDRARAAKVALAAGGWKFDASQAFDLYASAFRDYFQRDLADSRLSEAEAARLIIGSPIRGRLVAALDDWAMVEGSTRPARRDRLRRIAAAADAEPKAPAAQLRQALLAKDVPAIRKLVASAPLDRMSREALAVLGELLRGAGLRADAVRVLKAAHERFADDFWINFLLAYSLDPADPRTRPDAVRYYTAARAQQPDNPVVLSNLAHALKGLGRIEEEVALLRKALAREPNSPLILNNLGVALRDLRKLKESVEVWRRFTELRPKDPNGFAQLGSDLAELGKPVEAVAAFRKALALDPDNLRALAGIASPLGRLFRVEEAEAYARRAAKLNPGDGPSHMNVAAILWLRGKNEEHLAYLREAVEKAPLFMPLYQSLADCLQEQGELTEALQVYRKLARVTPSHPNDIRWREHSRPYQSYLVKKDLIPLLKVYDPIPPGAKIPSGRRISLPGVVSAAEDPRPANPADGARQQFVFGLADLIRRLNEAGKHDDAFAACRLARQLEPLFPTLHCAWGNVLRDRGQPAAAMVVYRQCLQLQPDNGAVHLNIGILLERNRQTKEAAAAYRTAIQLLSEDSARERKWLAIACNNLSVLVLHGEKNLAGALSLAKRATELDPLDANAHYNVSSYLFKQGKLEEAAAAARGAIKVNPNHPEAHCILGQVLLRQGRFAEARDAFRKAHAEGSGEKAWPYPSARWVQEAERLADLDVKLTAYLVGKRKPTDAAELLALAEFACDGKSMFAASARLHADALAAQPKLADDLKNRRRYVAACMAAAAANGMGRDAPAVNSGERPRLRRQALTLLRADLDARAQLARGGSAEGRAALADLLQSMQKAPALAGVRGKEALDKLPPDEREQWQKLWADAEALRKRAE